MDRYSLLIKIDTEMEKMMGRILVSKINPSYMLLLENRRKKHPLYPKLLELRSKELEDHMRVVGTASGR
jgi:hypothetical protein